MESNLGNYLGTYRVRLVFLLATLTTPLLGSFIFALILIYPLLNPTAVDPRLFTFWWMYLIFGLAMLLSWIFYLKDALKSYAIYENGIVEKHWLGKSKVVYFNQLNSYMKNHVGGLFGWRLYHYFFFADNPNAYGSLTVMEISSRYKTDEKLDNRLVNLPTAYSPFLSSPR